MDKNQRIAAWKDRKGCSRNDPKSDAPVEGGVLGPRLAGLRQQWRSMKWAEKEVYFIAAHINKEVKAKLLRHLFSGKPGFEAYCGKLRGEVVTANSVRRQMEAIEAQRLHGRNQFGPLSAEGTRTASRKQSAEEKLQSAWRKLSKLEEHSSSQQPLSRATKSDTAAKMALVHQLTH